VPSTTTGQAVSKFELAPRAFVDFARRNLFGSNRSVDLFASASLHPADTTSSATVGAGFTEYRLVGTFHEPTLAGTSIDGLLTGTIEQQIRSSFNFSRRNVTAQVARRIARTVSISAAYQLQTTHLLDVNVPPSEQPTFDRVFANVRLSSVGVTAAWDTRDDPVDPTTGDYLSAYAQLAARRIGSEVGFAKSFFEGKLVRTLPRSRGVVFVGNARLGLATGFPREVGVDANGQPLTERDLPEPERFFAGGDTTVRGFALDTLGRPDTITSGGFPIGGNAETIFNAELRSPLRAGVGVVGFVDTGNVFAHAVDIDLGALRSAVGFGVRYKSPVGPLRVDLGFKVNRQPGEALTAWFISFGQAF
jgi:outer membrane protein assembly factor BamA